MKTNNRIYIEEITPHALDDILLLGESYYTLESPNRSHEYLEHLYIKNPLGRAVGCYYYEDKLLIGFMALIPVALTSGDGSRIGYYCVNVLTHQSHRNKNIFVKLIDIATNFLSEKGSILIGHPNKMAAPFWKRKRMVFQKDLLPSIIFPSFIRRVKKVTKKTFDTLLPSSFWNEVSKENTTLVRYTAPYFRWRYLNEYKEYIVYSVFEGKRVVGVLVLKKAFFGVYLLIEYCHAEGFHEFTFKSIPNLGIIMTGSEDNLVRHSHLDSLLPKKIIKYFLTDYSSGNKPLINSNKLSLGASDF